MVDRETVFEKGIAERQAGCRLTRILGKLGIQLPPGVSLKTYLHTARKAISSWLLRTQTETAGLAAGVVLELYECLHAPKVGTVS